MKNYPYSTGRTVTISLDNLGNADLWQLFTIVTAGTNNVFEGDEPDADPRADSDAAMQVFLHIAETADDRADGADAGQRNFLLGTKEEYLNVFEDGDGPANVTANEEPETITRTALSGCEYTAAKVRLAEEVAERNACPVSLTDDADARELRATGTAAAIEDFFAFCREAAEEAALDKSETAALDAVTMYLGDEGNEPLREAIEVAAENCKRDANNIFAAGRFEGAAAMLAAQIWATGASHGATRAQMIEAAYRAYGVAW